MPTINKTLTGFDATILLDGKIVGRSENFTVTIEQGNEFIYEQGTRKPVEIKEKKFAISGELSGYFIDYELVKKALGGTSFSEVLPYFTIQGYMKNPSDNSVKAVTLQFVKFDGIDITVPLEASITQKCKYKALNIVFS